MFAYCRSCYSRFFYSKGLLMALLFLAWVLKKSTCYECNIFPFDARGCEGKVGKELAHRRKAASPFRNTPLTHRRRFPQDTVPKKTPGEFRLVYHLSYPEGERVNDYIDTLLCSVSFVPLDQVMQITRNSEGSVRWEVEKERHTTPYPRLPVTHRAAHMLPEHHDRFHLLLKGFRLGGNIYIDKGMHMGSVALH